MSLAFDYQALGPLAQEARQAADEIRGHLSQSLRHIVMAGQKLTQVKAKIPHGWWLRWLLAEFTLTPRTAARYMAVARLLGPALPDGLDGEPRAGYALLGQTAEVVEGVMGLAARGQYITVHVITAVVEALDDLRALADEMVGASEDVTNLALSYHVAPEAIAPLRLLEAKDPAAFAEVCASGCIEGADGEVILLSEANGRDVRDFVLHTRLEGRMVKQATAAQATAHWLRFFGPPDEALAQLAQGGYGDDETEAVVAFDLSEGVDLARLAIVLSDRGLRPLALVATTAGVVLTGRALEAMTWRVR